MSFRGGGVALEEGRKEEEERLFCKGCGGLKQMLNIRLLDDLANL